MSVADIAGNSVQLSTLMKWCLGDSIGYETEERNGKVMVETVHCIICARHIEKIKKDGKIRGQVQKEVEIYAYGTKNVKKFAVMRHLNGSGHKVALDYDRLLGQDVEDEDSDYGYDIMVTGGSQSGTQPRIDKVLSDQSRDAYKKLFQCTYNVATNGLPMRTFTTLVQTLKDVGVTLISGCDSPQRCVDFLTYIADEERRRIKILITDATSFSVLSDGSQARKTGCEKELVYVRVFHNGSADYFCTALQDMDEYGAANANNLKKAIDDVFLSKLGVNEEDYTCGLVSASADGAAVNTGALSGLFTQLQEYRPWMVNIHCISHRVELAIKDSLMDKSAQTVNFSQVLQFLISLFYLMKKSPKVQRVVAATANTLNVQVYKAKKVHGTRFVNHQRLGLQCLLNNWIIYIIAFEALIAEKANTTQKLPGILLKLRNVRFLVLCVYYKSVLDIIAKLSLKFERGDIAAFEVLVEIDKTIDEIDVLIDDETDFIEVLSESGVTYNPDTNMISRSLLKKGHSKKKVSNREYQSVDYSGMIKENGTNADAAIRGVRSKILPKVNECLRKRFCSFDQKVFRDMLWLNPENWDDDNTSAEVESLVQLAEHFECREPEEYHVDKTKLKREWKSLRHSVKHYYSKLKCKQIWKKIMTYRKSEFPNVCKLVEIVLCLGPSNCTVESGFSHLTAMLTDRRLGMSHKTMENNLIVKVNNKVFTQTEKEEILEEALENFLTRKRKQKLSTENEVNKRQKLSDESDDDIETVEQCDVTDNELSDLDNGELTNNDYDEDIMWEPEEDSYDPLFENVVCDVGEHNIICDITDMTVVQSIVSSLVDSACLDDLTE